MRRMGDGARRAGAALAGLGALVALYAATYSPRNITDTDLNSLQTRALVLHGDIDLSRYRLDPRALWVSWRGARYSIYGVGVSLPALPVYAPLVRLGASENLLQAAASIPFVAAAAILLFRLLSGLFSRWVAWGWTVVFALGTTMWPLAAMAFYQNGPTQLFQVLGLLGLFSRRRGGPALAGFGFAAAAMVRPLAGFALAFAGLFYLLRDRRALGPYVAGALAPLAVIVVQNRWIWGGWLTGGYSHNIAGFRGDVPKALWELLFGWWRGMLVYSPVLGMGFVGLAMALRRARGFVESRLLVAGATALATILLYARFTTWWGGLNQFGYRYLLDAVPFLCLLGAYACERSPRVRAWSVPLGLLSVLTMTFGAAPNRFALDGTLFATRLEDTSLGQAWIVALDRPLETLARLGGVALVAGVLAWAAPRMGPRPGPAEAVPGL
jgi:hypothetical protein